MESVDSVEVRRDGRESAHVASQKDSLAAVEAAWFVFFVVMPKDRFGRGMRRRKAETIE